MRDLIAVAFGAFLALAMGACNSVGTCPAAGSIVNGGSCSGDMLECPYTLPSLSPACDGTMVEGGIQTSCVCTSGTWVCPSAVECEAGSGDDGSTPDSAGSGDDGNTADSPADSPGGG
jgi:hypothetical protein